MSEHHTTVRWTNPGDDFDHARYSRDHVWLAKDGRVRLQASAAPAYQGNPDTLDPEDAFVGALAACHMLTFLSIAAKRRHRVTSYVDEACGTLGTDADGRMAMVRVVLRPVVTFVAGSAPDAEAFAALHARAHTHCFIGNSVRTEVVIEPVLVAGPAPG